MSKEYCCEDCDFETDNIGALGSHKKYVHGKDGRFAKKRLEQRLDELAQEVNSMPEITKGEVEEIIKRELQNSNFCKDFPDLCNRVGKLEEQGNKVYDIVSSHPIPNESLLHLWENCEECRPKYREMLARGAFNPKEKVAVGAEESLEGEFPWVQQED